MRQLAYGRPVHGKDPALFKRWVEDCLAEIQQASYEGVETVAQDFRVTNHTESLTLDASAATLDELRQVVGTLLIAMKNLGTKRT